jgi:hypothetical protein
MTFIALNRWSRFLRDANYRGNMEESDRKAIDTYMVKTNDFFSD